MLFVDKGRAEPESRFGEWERRLLASADAGASSGLRSVRRRVACTTADCQETVHVRDYPAP